MVRMTFAFPNGICAVEHFLPGGPIGGLHTRVIIARLQRGRWLVVEIERLISGRGIGFHWAASAKTPRIATRTEPKSWARYGTNEIAAILFPGTASATPANAAAFTTL